MNKENKLSESVFKNVTWIPIDDLIMHPDAGSYGADADDRSILDESVASDGVLTPIIVMRGVDGYQILDGCGRFQAAKKAGLDTMPCVVVDSCDDPRRFVSSVNAFHRKITTGSRVLSYVMMNREKVVAAMESIAVGRGDPHGKNTGALRNKVPSELKDWTFKGIADRLSVSRKDVSYAVELMICQAECKRPLLDMHNGGTVREQIEDEDEQRQLDVSFNAVLMGRLPIRRWTAAFKGKMKTEGQGRVATDYLACANRALVSLGTAFRGWQEIPLRDRETVLDTLDDLLKVAPEDVVALLKKRYESVKK